MADQTQDSLLSLATIKPRRKITVDDKNYELRWPQELGVFAEFRVDRGRLRSLEILELTKTRDASPEEERELSTLLGDLISDLVVDGAEFASRLGDKQKLLVVNAFLSPAGATPAKPPTAAAMKRARQPKKKLSNV
jgi:hypothetical protein